MKILFLTNNFEPTKSLYEWLSEREDVFLYSEKLTVEFVKDFDFIVSYNYVHIIKEDIINLHPNNIVNLHISLLPYNKGIQPNLWSFIEDTPKGVTIHRIDKGLDTGEILCQKEVFFDINKETLKTTYERLHFEIQELFKKNWDNIKNNTIQHNTTQYNTTQLNTCHTRVQTAEIIQKYRITYDEVIADIISRTENQQ
ncbi:MAG: formyl transferase [Oscillospiraceae bacterium]|jgi:methionyl-tRNA formyltransferase|nr:formyl transferase [Oscillospiraceae bacterium]